MKNENTISSQLLGKLIPVNLEEEKERFFFDSGYNPQFVYQETISKQELGKYGPPDATHLALAKSILDKVIEKYGSESQFLHEIEGPVLTQEESLESIGKYLEENSLTDRVKLIFSKDFVARTAVKNIGTAFELRIRLPAVYRRDSLQGVLDHEIGTHVIRWINEMQQPWFGHHADFRLLDHLETEEGFASLHGVLSRRLPYLWMPALYYYSTYLASQMSFTGLNQALRPYIDDRERRWARCFRAKRGVGDTSTHESFTKDQVYFSGTLKVLRWLKAHEYDLDLPYMGKVALQDLPRLEGIRKPPTLVPEFAQDRKKYKHHLEEIIHLNKLEKALA